MGSINGVPYPIDVKDETSFARWIESIDREKTVASMRGPVVLTTVAPSEGNRYREAYAMAYFETSDAAGQAWAKAIVCQRMAMSLFSHLIHAPKGRIIWRIEPEFDVSVDSIPSDLSRRLTRPELEKRFSPEGDKPAPLDAFLSMMPDGDEWAVDYCTDSVFHAATKTGEWSQFKGYMRYAIVVGDDVVSTRFPTAA